MCAKVCPVLCISNMHFAVLAKQPQSCSSYCTYFLRQNASQQQLCRSLVDTLPEDEEAVLSGQQARRPVAWLLLRPARNGPGQQMHAQRALALPISCDAALPDFIVKADVFEKGMRRHWHQKDRFRMFFASSYTNKTGR